MSAILSKWILKNNISFNETKPASILLSKLKKKDSNEFKCFCMNLYKEKKTWLLYKLILLRWLLNPLRFLWNTEKKILIDIQKLQNKQTNKPETNLKISI
jgi:hypothetical protein